MAAKPFTISGPPTPALMNRIDRMFTDLYKSSGGLAHNLLSASHADVVVPSAVTRGGMLIVNSVKKWAQVVPTVAGTYPRYDGADVTFSAISETDITDGTIFARVASAETITGRWFFSGTGRVVLANAVPIQARNSGNSADVNIVMLSSNILSLGNGNDADVETLRLQPRTTIDFRPAGTSRMTITASEVLPTIPVRGANGAINAPTYSFNSFSTTGMYAATGPLLSVSVASGEAMRWDGNLTTFHGGAVCFGATLTPATLASGSNNNYNPTNFAVNVGLRITGHATPSTISGLVAPTNGAMAGDGRMIILWNIGSPTWSISHEDTNSTDVNRVLTATGATRDIVTNSYIALWYDTTSNRWREFACGAGGGATVGGSDTQFQYNNGGVLGGASGMVYDDATGFVGLGKVPTTILDLQQTAGSCDMQVTCYGGVPELVQRRVNGTTGSPTAVLSGDLMAVYYVAGWTSAGAFSTGNCAHLFIARENFTSTNQGASFVFQSVPTGTNVASQTLHITASLGLHLGPTYSVPSTGTVVMTFDDGTAPSGMATNTAGLYANNVGSTVEMFAIDEAGAATQISPHGFELFTPEPGEPYPWSYSSKNDYLGEEVNIDLSKLARLVEVLTGEKIIHRRSYAPTRNWADDQQMNLAKQMEAYTAKHKDPRTRYPVVKDPPPWLKTRLETRGLLNTNKMAALQRDLDNWKPDQQGGGRK
jgi:hypothetical protein